MLLIQTRVAPSDIHGLGLFAIEPVPVGTPVWRFQAGFDRELAPDEVAGWPEPARRHARSYGFINRVDRRVTLDGDHACFMNHAAMPNTGAPAGAQHPITTVALRDIAAGEEITCDYYAFDADAAWKLAQPGVE